MGHDLTSDDIVTRLRQMATDRARYATHTDGCVEWHIECAALHACDQIERLRAVVKIGDRLVTSIRDHDLNYAVLREWEAARRG